MKSNFRFWLPIAVGAVGALVMAGLAVAGPLLRPKLQGGAPTMVSYQGYVTVSGSPYNGTGYFKFAIVNAAGNATYWSNDGTSSGGGAPTNAVALTVSGGLFSVLLGDTSLTNMTQALSALVFNGTDRYLRVWFSQNAGGPFTQLSPDRRFAAAPYALQAEEAKDADTLDGNHASAFQQHYQNVKIVAKSGGDYTTITDALNSISDASDTNRYLVKVMPGVYNERVTMKQYVDIEGAGELTTKITYTGGYSADGTVAGANNAELRFLTVENTGGPLMFAIAINNNSASPRLTHLTVTASGGKSYNIAIYNRSSSSPTITNVTASAFGGDTLSTGVENYPGSSVTIQNSTISASGGGQSVGIYNEDLGGTYSVTVNNSQITGSTYTIYNMYDYTTRVGASQLAGGAVSNCNGGCPATCAGVYDENYVFYANTCP